MAFPVEDRFPLLNLYDNEDDSSSGYDSPVFALDSESGYTSPSGNHSNNTNDGSSSEEATSSEEEDGDDLDDLSDIDVVVLLYYFILKYLTSGTNHCFQSMYRK
jgi:hypothetical protein